MYRGFTILCPPRGAPHLRLSLVDAGRRHRPSLVTVSHDEGSRTAAILLGRIFYRDDLVARLPDPQGLREVSDAALALAAYRHLGRRGLEQIEGEFALVVWDSERGCVWAQRDPFGTWPLFWSVGGGAIGVSTSLQSLSDEQPTRSFNLDAMAEFLMQPMPADELAGEQTAYEGIQRVRPGSIVELSLTGSVRRHTYWDWTSRIGRTEVDSREEAGQELASRLRQAVRERMPHSGGLAAHLSGGMDSSSIVCLARDYLSSCASPSRLYALSLVYRRRSLAAERSYIDSVLRQGGPVEARLLDGEEILYFDWFRQELPLHDEPTGLLTCMPFHRALVNASDQLGAVMTLSGEGSDEIAYFLPYHIADHLRRGRWLAAFREACRWSTARNQGLWSVLGRYRLEPLWPVLLRDGLGPYLRRGYGAWPRLGFFSIPPWVRLEFASRHRMRQLGRDYARRMYGHPTEVSWDRSMFATTSGDWLRWNLAAPLGLNLSHPFRDPRVVCFTMGLPRQLHAVPGLTKPVLQAAMRGVLPDEILDRRDKRGFDDVYGLGLRENLPDLERLVWSAAIQELGIVDIAKLIPAMHQASLGIGDARATDRLDKTLALIAWFEQVTRRRPLDQPFESHRLGEGPTRGKPDATILAGRH
jgi:asparagine synthase (glutamine-hydrolysing)